MSVNNVHPWHGLHQRCPNCWTYATYTEMEFFKKRAWYGLWNYYVRCFTCGCDLISSPFWIPKSVRESAVVVSE